MKTLSNGNKVVEFHKTGKVMTLDADNFEIYKRFYEVRIIEVDNALLYKFEIVGYVEDEANTRLCNSNGDSVMFFQVGRSLHLTPASIEHCNRFYAMNVSDLAVASHNSYPFTENAMTHLCTIRGYIYE